MKVLALRSGFQSGIFNMALDEALLEHVRTCTDPMRVVRVYGWEEPTLSLGVHQPVRDVRALLNLYGRPDRPVKALVRRPTGGRAILHGSDISFSFVTNDKALLGLTLKDSYAVLTTWVRAALDNLGIAVSLSDQAGDREYLRSPVCFETHTASDLIAPNGHKLAGSAQLRRAGGLLQHGAAFLQPYQVDYDTFANALFAAVARAHGMSELPPFPIEVLADRLPALEAAYRKESGEVLASASTTSGSHLEPASS